MASVHLGEERRTVCFFGEGAMAEGVFYESLNMAALWRIPVLFCCENNLYAMGTALERSQSQTNLLKKVEAFNIQGSSVDGMSVLETFEKTKYALSFIEREKRPYFLEFKTYRFKAHSMFDPELYRRKSEVLLWKEKCPIESLQKELTLSEMSLKEMDEKIEDEMQEAIIFAENSLEESKEEFIEAHHDTYL
jgi:pyruvate dehydrogenase E1 component alpha subunit